MISLFRSIWSSTPNKGTTWKHMCIAHYIHVAKVVVEEEKKGKKPRPNKLHPQSTNTQNEYDTQVPSLENWDGGMYMYIYMCTCTWKLRHVNMKRIISGKGYRVQPRGQPRGQMDNLFHDVCHVAYVCGHKKVGSSKAPDTELSAILSISLTRTMIHVFAIFASLHKMAMWTTTVTTVQRMVLLTPTVCKVK